MDCDHHRMGTGRPRQYLQIPTGATAPWEVLFYACMSLHAERGLRVLIPAKQV